MGLFGNSIENHLMLKLRFALMLGSHNCQLHSQLIGCHLAPLIDAGPEIRIIYGLLNQYNPKRA